ncbi:MerC domain-containing protein [Thalassoroseus pseudoceratinae]|uniref:MerC domain-containing protein n=1 Tax=Thalassoroseus pseudoceratinae TaxID=2713176 RepID=UPI0014233CCF|nr:MerC domain-containing protein [Thalassoroseus pseudoceratinae]
MSKKKPSGHDLGEADGIGMLFAGLCLAHCVAMPILVTFLPNTEALASEGAIFHQMFAMVSLMISLLAFLPSYWHHRRRLVVGLATGGLLLQLFSAFVLSDPCCSGMPSDPLCRRDQFSLFVGPVITPLGGVLLLAAHGLNRYWAGYCQSQTLKRQARSRKPR